jgi:pyruvate,water dikinase
MLQNGLSVPHGMCLPTGAYERFVRATGLRERILLELNRKPFHEMRWEEIWDAALRIRNLFLRTPLPDALAAELRNAVADAFADRPVVARSSAPGEDAAGTSFAGLHESYVNISGADEILEHVKLIWASLWSDRALLYRQELNLSVESSAIAVIMQELIAGDKSGVAFSRSPQDTGQAVIEAVYALNQGLVDGVVEPDRWILDRATGEIVSHKEPPRTQCMVRG